MRMVILAVFLWGCAGGTETPTDGSGSPELWQQIYEVTHHTKNTSSCVSEGENQPFGEPYFRLAENDESGIDYHICRTFEDCDDFREDAGSFDEEVKDDKFEGHLQWNACCDDGCQVFGRLNTLKIRDDGSVSIERMLCLTDYGDQSEDSCDSFTSSNPQCTSSTMGCGEYVVMDAVPVQ